MKKIFLGVCLMLSSLAQAADFTISVQSSSSSKTVDYY